MRTKRLLYVGIAYFFFSLTFSHAKTLEVIATSKFPINGIAITSKGRMFVSIPQWIDEPSPSVAEVFENGSIKAYPNNIWNAFDKKKSYQRFTNVNAVHVDHKDNLWVVDYAAPFWSDPIKGSQKLVKINTSENQVEKVYRFDEDILPEGAKLNDVRVDLNKQVAYISEFGIGALIVLDLPTGKARRLLHRHYSARAHPDVVTYFDGKPFSTAMLQLNDIELDNKGEYLYYQPTGGPILYRIKTKHLLNTSLNQRQLSDKVEVYSKSLTIGGITKDKNDTFYLGNVQDNAVTILKNGQVMGNLVQDDRLLWPDAMSVYKRYLYIPAPQLRLLPKFNNGEDKTRGQFKVYRYPL